MPLEQRVMGAQGYSPDEVGEVIELIQDSRRAGGPDAQILEEFRTRAQIALSTPEGAEQADRIRRATDIIETLMGVESDERPDPDARFAPFHRGE